MIQLPPALALALAELPPVVNRARVEKWADFVYTRRGQVAHVLPFSAGYGTYGGHRISDGEALCLRSPSVWDEWHGTGSQAEAEKARHMPVCVRCEFLSRGRTR